MFKSKQLIYRHCMAQTRARTQSMSLKVGKNGLQTPKLPSTRKARLHNGNSRSLHKIDEGASQDVRKEEENSGAQEIDSSHFLNRIPTPWKIGAHVSSAGGVENAVINASSIGANAFALFLKPQRKWTASPLTESSIIKFKTRMRKFGYESRHIVPHGSYLINLANPDDAKRTRSYDCFLDELKRCEALGLEMYNFHPGSTVGATTIENSISHIADCVNRAHQETNGVTILLENMAGGGNIVGGDFAHLAQIIDLIKDKSRVGVCFDTCHAFAAGYDIRTKDAWDDTIHHFSSIIGLRYLRAIHLNDSLCPFQSRKDRHQNVGLGEIGIGGFHHIVRDERTKGIPMILETPSFDLPQEVLGVEIGVLGQLSLMHESTSRTESDNGNVEKLVEEIKLVVSKARRRANAKQKRIKED